MNDEWALRQAVLAAPEDDVPRLVYADWLEDAGEGERARFLRDQVQLAKTPPWEPFAVRVKHHRPEVLSGQPWRDSLPGFGDARLVEWHPERPFHRGFGWSVRIRQLGAFLASAERLFDIEPVGELVLPSATRDEWEAFAHSPWLAKIQRLRFTTGSGLSEPIRALAASPFAARINGIAFDVSTSPGMGAVVELLMQSPLAAQLEDLEFRIGHDRDGEILEELNRAHNLKLKTLTLATMGQGAEALVHLANLPNAGGLHSLAIQHQPVGGAVASAIAAGLQVFPLRQFAVLAGQLTGADILGFTSRTVQALNLSENIFGEESLQGLCGDRYRQLRSLQLRGCGLDDSALAFLTTADFWPGLVELDLSRNRFGDLTGLMTAPPPPELSALVLTDMTIPPEMLSRLRDHYGDAVIVSENTPDTPTNGLG